MGLKASLISVAARSSPLSQAQVKEVLVELHKFHPSIEFEPFFVESQGDKDQATSLRTMEKSNFFTKEIDDLVLNHQCRVGIHSAKDLPDPLPPGLQMVALTAGIDPADVLVMRPGASLETLPSGALIATSSQRREEALRQMRQDLCFTDLRGIISQRLAKLESGQVDGIIVAEAALIRLGLTHLNRVRILGETAPFQGQLAILTRTGDEEMGELFSCLDCRLKPKGSLLYLGLDYPKWITTDKKILHYPIIAIQPVPFETKEVQEAYQDLPNYSHLLFTSKNSVRIFFKYLILSGLSNNTLENKVIISIGKETAEEISRHGVEASLCSLNETSEGIIQTLQQLNLLHAYIFWPHSALSRLIISNYFQKQQILFKELILYTTVPNSEFPKPDLHEVDEIAFSSPSCIDAFLEFYHSLPRDKTYHCIGPITLEKLRTLDYFATIVQNEKNFIQERRDL